MRQRSFAPIDAPGVMLGISQKTPERPDADSGSTKKRRPVMKKQVITFALVAVFVFAGFAARSGVNAFAIVHPGVREQLVGSWSLASRVSTLANGEVLPDRGLAATPKGLLIYDRTGHVAAQLSRQGRTVEMIGEECQEAAKIRGTNDTAQTVLGYDAYFGTFTVNEKDGFVVHHLESALFPGDVGKDIKRNFTISGDRLTIKFNTTTADGTPVTRTLVWERMK
jgi:Lipocalin-like domain